MPSYAQITILGHVGSIVSNYTKTGKKITNFTVAVNRKRGNNEETDWFNVKTTMEWVDKGIEKGDLVMVIGEPQSRLYNGKTYWDIWANTIKQLTKKQKEEELVDAPPF
ncbi:single-stranded DNA-binding protein [Thermosipho japonicus]|uniref:Single-stranded DNA-binding protein n=1 Tax=Thermosipho japonicus TaxID=90323 RepID=A0A841GIS2_9BACT|nr:single-stranded DNA-binding protein [Thermosipho japonicus]MBB6061905.1 single-stranded DNA-binding protein [Thermosipho japonicus]